MLPERVEVGPTEYRVVRDVAWLARCSRMGEADHYEGVIKIQEGLPESQEWETFWHEVCHCVDHNYLNGKLDEDEVACFARGLYQAVKSMGLLEPQRFNGRID